MSDTQKIYTVAIAGLGRRGIHHAQAFSGNPHFEVVGLCDLDEERMQAAAEQFDISYTNTDAAQMLADTQADIFTFCTLPSVRLPLIRVGVEADVTSCICCAARASSRWSATNTAMASTTKR